MFLISYYLHKSLAFKVWGPAGRVDQNTIQHKGIDRHSLIPPPVSPLVCPVIPDWTPVPETDEKLLPGALNDAKESLSSPHHPWHGFAEIRQESEEFGGRTKGGPMPPKTVRDQD